MANSRRTGGRRKGAKRSTARTSRATVNKIAKYTANRLIETKKYNTQKVEQTVSTLSGYFYHDEYMQLTQGDAYSGFTGHWVNGIGLYFKTHVFNQSAQTVVGRLLIFINKQGAGNTDYRTNAGLFLESNGGNESVASNAGVISMLKRLDKDRYVTLYDKVIKLSPTGVDSNCVFTMSKYIPLKMRRINYNGSNILPTINNIACVFFTARSDDDESLGSSIEISQFVTFYYKDA